jgi:GxxExxY protein
MEINDLTGIVIEESIKLHSDIGPGLLESVYEEVLYYPVEKKGIGYKKTIPNPFPI